MFKLDNAFLEELGLGTLPAVEKNKMLAHIYETLEMRVGMRLAEQMSNEQLDEFESYINKQDEAGALKWLETNFPDYKKVVAEELEKLKSEISQVAPQIVAQAAANQQPQQVQQPIQDPSPQIQAPGYNPQSPIPPQAGGPQSVSQQPQVQQLATTQPLQQAPTQPQPAPKQPVQGPSQQSAIPLAQPYQPYQPPTE